MYDLERLVMFHPLGFIVLSSWLITYGLLMERMALSIVPRKERKYELNSPVSWCGVCIAQFFGNNIGC